MKRLILTAFFLLSILGAQAQDSKALSRPGPRGQPIEVKVSLLLLSISEINVHSQEFTASIFVRVSWKDERLKFERQDGGSIERSLDEIWHPALQIINLKEAETILPDNLRVSASGQVVYEQRIIGSFEEPMDVRDFPLDQQALHLQIVSAGYLASEVRLVQDTTVYAGELVKPSSLPDWNIREIQTKVSDEKLLKAMPAKSLYVLTVLAERKTGFYFLKVIIPMLLVVMMSWVVFWMHPQTGADQIQIAATSMLTMIAFRFAVAQVLPEVSYSTRMDQFISVSTLLVFLTMMEALYTLRAYDNEKLDHALKVDFYSRFLFPLVFVTVGLFIFLS